jgi:tRNA(adenine34) deaminase
MKSVLRVRTSAVVIHNNQILCFFAVDPTSGREFHFLPGGAIEKGETAPDAAVRETLEETGYQIRVATSSAVDSEYLFHWNGEDFLSHTLFYRGYLLNPFQKPTPVSDASYNKGVLWVPIVKVQEIFSYTQEIAQAIEQLAEWSESSK